MYNLLSDKLDRFEKEMRVIRNQIVGKSLFGLYVLFLWLFMKLKPYIHTEYLRSYKEKNIEWDRNIE